MKMIRHRSILELEQLVVVAATWCHKMDRLMEQMMGKPGRRMEQKMERRMDKLVQKMGKPVAGIVEVVKVVTHKHFWFLEPVIVDKPVQLVEQNCIHCYLAEHCRIELEVADNCSSCEPVGGCSSCEPVSSCSSCEPMSSCSSCEPVISTLVEPVAGILLVNYHSCQMTGRNFGLMIHVHCYYNQIVDHKIVEPVAAVGRKKKEKKKKSEKKKSIQQKKVESKQTMKDRRVDDCTMGQPLLHNLKLEHRDYY